jgi:UDP-N-acetylmuramate dehydrogenase
VFHDIKVTGNRLRAGCSATLRDVVQIAAKARLAGLESLVGLTGTMGGALLLNAGDRSSDLGQFVRRVEVVDSSAHVIVREHEELRFGSCGGPLDDPVVVSAECELEPDQPDAIVKRLRKAWILHTASHPLPHEAAARMFKDPPGMSATDLITQAELAGFKVGKARVSERHANYVVVEPGATARDVIELLDEVRGRVEDVSRIELQTALSIW